MNPTTQPTDTAAWFKYTTEALTAIGTVGAVFLALFSEWAKRHLWNPKLSLQYIEKRGAFVNAEKPYIAFHLTVVNLRPRYAALNSRVMIREIRRLVGTDFEPVYLAHHLQLRWPGKPPQNNQPLQITVRTRETCDFGNYNQDGFCPVVYHLPATFDGKTGASQTVRYYIEVVADNYAPTKPQVFQVHWNGSWEQDPDKHNVTIKEVTDSA